MYCSQIPAGLLKQLTACTAAQFGRLCKAQLQKGMLKQQHLIA